MTSASLTVIQPNDFKPIIRDILKIDGTYFVLNMKFADNRNTNNVTTDEFFLKRGDLSMGVKGRVWLL